jgi:hypothetical protein
MIKDGIIEQTPKEKALELTNKVSLEMEQLPYSFCKCLAKFTVNEIKEVLRIYGEEVSELPYMESEFSWWDNVIKEIESL